MAKDRPQGIAVHSEEQVTRLARRNARWTRVPPAFQVREGDEDPHELLDELNEQERRDAKAFREGQMQKCCVGLRIEDEEREEQLSRLYS